MTENEINKLKQLLKKACTCEEFLLEMLTREEWEFLREQGIISDGEWYDK